jgi:glycosyltransferase involved in cell wall biosynthesis
VPGDYSAAENYPLDGAFNVAVISSFASDERVGIVLEAAARLPDVTFRVTGDSRRIPRSLLKNKPDNCRLTGYLPYARYVGLLRGVDAIAALSTRNHTLLMGGFEAVSLGKPLLVSDWPLLRDYFSLGAVYVPNTVEGLCEGVRQVRGHQADLQRGILALKKELEEEWERKFTQLQGILTGV